MVLHILTGTVQSGADTQAMALRGAKVTLYRTSNNHQTLIGTATTDPNGIFTIHNEAPGADGIYFVFADVANGVRLAAVIGEVIDPAATYTVNELTTVATGFALAQFIQGSAILGTSFALRIAAGMAANLVSVTSGEPSPVMLHGPNGDQTNSLRSLRALGNLLAGCVRGAPDALANVLTLTTPPHGTAPADTFQAIANVALHPANNAAGLYTQAQATGDVYTPSLENLPQAWTLAVKVNDSGDDDYLFGGPANVAWDKHGYAWVANNVVQGTPNSASCIMVLRPDGKPADGRGGLPKSPVSGGGITGVGFGITVAPDGNVWVGNFGWGDVMPANGVSAVDAAGNPISVPDGYDGGTANVQGTVADPDGNIWLASFGNDRVVVFPQGDPTRAFGWPPLEAPELAPATCPFDVAVAADGSAWVTYSGGLGWPKANPGHLCRYRIVDGSALECTFSWPLGEVTKGVALDSAGNAWIAAGGHDSAVYMVSADCSKVRRFTGGGIDGPWSVAVDGDDNVWVANFGRMGVTSDYTTAGVTKLAGIRPPNGFRTGDPISPPSGYTLPSAGEQVRLHNHHPLNGPAGPPCYSPLMRMTSVVVDAAGNLWAVNNWKPDFGTDFSPSHGNPGGDGIVIFVGVAKPPASSYGA